MIIKTEYSVEKIAEKLEQLAQQGKIVLGEDGSTMEIVQAGTVQNVQADVVQSVQADVVQNVQADVVQSVQADVVQNVQADMAQSTAGRYIMRLQMKKAHYNWILTPEDQQLHIKTELTLGQGICLLRDGFYLMGLIFILAVLARMAITGQMLKVMAAALIGLIPIWLLAISLVLNFVVPGKTAKMFLNRRFISEKNLTA